MLIHNINIVSFCNFRIFVVVDCRHERQTHPAQNETLTADTCDEGPTQDDLYNCHRRIFNDAITERDGDRLFDLYKLAAATNTPM